MAIQYSGGPYVNSVANISSKQAMANFVQNALLAAGWTTISGTPGAGVTDVIQESAAQNAGGKIRIRSNANEAGWNGAAFRMRDPNGVLTETGPVSGGDQAAGAKVWRIVANKYCFWAFKSGAAERNTNRNVVMAGTMFTPSFFTTASGDAVGWMLGTNDGDNNAYISPRQQLAEGSGGFLQPSSAMLSAVVRVQSVNSGALMVWQAGTSNASQGWRWEDNTLPVIEPLYYHVWPSERMIIGQWYDSAIIAGNAAAWAGETTLNFDNHTWLIVTDAPNANAGSDAAFAVVIA